MTTGMQSCDAATGVLVDLFIMFSLRSGMLKTNKQALLYNLGEDLSYFFNLRYKLRDLIKIYDDFVNGSIKGIFRRLCHYFRSAEKVWWNTNGFGCIQHVKAC